jgi:NAD(P)-dependent dehydrogenase (short-subunit alcohol dehydrogenase family)
LILDARGRNALEEVQFSLSRWTKVTAIAGDVSDALHRQALALVARRIGGLDAVINNASQLGPSPMPALLDYPLEALEQVYQVNVFGILGLLQDLKSAIKEGGRILNVTSDAGIEAYPGWGGYGSSKAALEQLSKILAAENPHWRIYWVDPGDMRTQMHQEAFPGEDISDRPLPEDTVPGFIALLEGDLPSGHYRSRELVAERA